MDGPILKRSPYSGQRSRRTERVAVAVNVMGLHPCTPPTRPPCRTASTAATPRPRERGIRYRCALDPNPPRSRRAGYGAGDTTQRCGKGSTSRFQGVDLAWNGAVIWLTKRRASSASERHHDKATQRRAPARRAEGDSPGRRIAPAEAAPVLRLP